MSQFGLGTQGKAFVKDRVEQGSFDRLGEARMNKHNALSYEYDPAIELNPHSRLGRKQTIDALQKQYPEQFAEKARLNADQQAALLNIIDFDMEPGTKYNRNTNDAETLDRVKYLAMVPFGTENSIGLPDGPLPEARTGMLGTYMGAYNPIDNMIAIPGGSVNPDKQLIRNVLFGKGKGDVAGDLWHEGKHQNMYNPDKMPNMVSTPTPYNQHMYIRDETKKYDDPAYKGRTAQQYFDEEG